jgi:hypothetical protein
MKKISGRVSMNLNKMLAYRVMEAVSNSSVLEGRVIIRGERGFQGFRDPPQDTVNVRLHGENNYFMEFFNELENESK